MAKYVMGDDNIIFFLSSSPLIVDVALPNDTPREGLPFYHRIPNLFLHFF